MNDGLVDVPIFEQHQRGRNWCANIESNPRVAGGLDRKFWSKARGEFYYIIPPDVRVGMAIEFGADYYTGQDRQRPKRWYGVIVERYKDALVLLETPTAIEATMLAYQVAHPPGLPESPK
jgi:hypothetical protein